MPGPMVLIGHTEQEDPIPTTVGQAFNWKDRLEEDLLEDKNAPRVHAGTAKMRGKLEAGDQLHVEATFDLNDGSQIHAAGTVAFAGGKVGRGTLVIRGAGSGKFGNSRGPIGVERINPKRYSIPR
jgi:3-hydroxymyristoyl/3-hydroxydecanoyl-(acyl carrier protein) dehydratase